MSTARTSGMKRTRQESRGVGTLKKLRKSPNGKLIVEFDELTGKAVGLHGKDFNNNIHIDVRDLISPTIFRWDDVPRATVDIIFTRVFEMFEVPTDNNIVMDATVKVMMSGLREEWCRMRYHWKRAARVTKEGVVRDPERAKQMPYKEIPLESWAVICDHFYSEKQQEISRKNSASRKKRQLEGGQGSKTIVAHAHAMANPETKELPSLVDTFHSLHFKENKGWRNDYAARVYGTMNELRSAQASNAAAPFVGSGNDNARPKDLDIMTQVLGSRSRYQKGYGSLPRLKAVGGTRAPASSSNRARQADQEEVARLKETVAQQATIIAQQQSFFAQLQVLMPGFQTSQQVPMSEDGLSN